MVMTSQIHDIYVHSYMSLCDFGYSLLLFQIYFYDLFIYLPTFSHNNLLILLLSHEAYRHWLNLFILPFLGINNFYSYLLFFSTKFCHKEVFTHLNVMCVLLNSFCNQKSFGCLLKLDSILLYAGS